MYDSTKLFYDCGPIRSHRPRRISSLRASKPNNDGSTQHFYLLCLTGSVHFKRNMLGQVLNRLSVVPLFLCFWHNCRVGYVSQEAPGNVCLPLMVTCTSRLIQGLFFSGSTSFRGTAGDHKGPPGHSSPLSPLRERNFHRKDG